MFTLLALQDALRVVFRYAEKRRKGNNFKPGAAQGMHRDYLGVGQLRTGILKLPGEPLPGGTTSMADDTAHDALFNFGK